MRKTKKLSAMLQKLKSFRFALLIILLAMAQIAFGQVKLSLEEAIGIALKNNYDIKLVNNDIQIAKNNLNPGNAGMLPTLEGSFSDGGSRQNITRTQSNGNQQTLDGVKNTSRSYGASLGWTIFDGLQMFTNYDRLKELQKLGEVNAKATILTTISDVISAYYTVLKEQRLVAAKDTALDISQLRLKIANNKLSIGRGSKLDVLAARVDYNTDTSSYLQELNLLKIAKITLNQVLARDINLDFKVNEIIDIDTGLNYGILTGQMEQLNPELQTALISKKIADLNLKQVKGQRYPVVAVNSGYEFQKSTSPTGFNTQQRANGFTYGLTASINIFNGFLQRQNERNAKIAINSSSLVLDKTRQDLKARLASGFQNYGTSLDLLKVEESNVDIARQNLDITLEKYRLGSISPLELREAQKNSIDAVIRFLEAQYQAKLTEVSLKEISGTLNIQ